MTDRSEKRLEIERMQKELKTASLKNKMMQFDIKVLELEEEIERLQKERANCEKAIEQIMEQ